MLTDHNFPNLRGKLTQNAPIGQESWFRAGGTADLLFQPADMEDLQEFLTQYFPSLHPASSSLHPDESQDLTSDPESSSGCIGGGTAGCTKQDKSLTIIGGLANTIVRDGGVRGVTLQLGKPFAQINVMDGIYIEAGCGALNGSLAAAAVKAGIGGLEFLSGIPGSFGGALAMNAGAYGTEIRDVLIGVKALTRAGEIKRYTADDLQMSYRHSVIPDGAILIGATLKGVAEDYETVKARMNDIKAKRNDTQPIREKTGGSTFANPSAAELRIAGLPDDTKAWQVVEKVGGRGLKRGGAQISEKHCNFMINTGGATASDLEGLGDEIIARAHKEFGLKLRWEIKRIGAP